MKNLLILLPLLLGASAAPLAAQAPALQGNGCQGPPSDVKLYVDVKGLRSSKGLVAVTLYADDKSKFLVKHGSIYVGRVDAHAPNTRVCMNLPRTGVYALGVYHDEDGDRHFKRNFVGMPVEGFGFSNNPGTFFGLPQFTAVRLNVPHGGYETTVNVRYP
ncbi:DUF2141 domain-containing protein [Sphingomonas sp.]|uniref:DUF2141 domain-containing protein n=1 Tax=Sphingomonas sp. TaxID=28214 RepID=UPI001B2ECB25|nr:DUF2141 domain-containing protein [Sphingomonas sp.]MBO9713259.1 DUF2141 domain-containing protein [Sphingomonas sp.]